MLHRISRIAAVLAVTGLYLATAQDAASKSKIKVACIGDSITNAAAGGGRAKAYPAQLQEILGDAYQVENFGVSGATMVKKGDLPYWRLTAFKNVKEFGADIVTIKLGTNDSKPQNWNKENYEADYREMIQTLKALPSKPTIILCRPVPAFTDAFGISDSMIKDEAIPIVDKLGKEFGLTVVDLYAALHDHADTFPDGIHPDEKGSRLIAETLAKAVSVVKRE